MTDLATMHARYDRLGLADVAARVLGGERLSIEDGERLFACPDVTALGALAHHARTRLHGDKTYFVVNRHLNYTNICVNGCLFCAYRRERGEDGAFALSLEEAEAKVRATPEDTAEIHVVGGCHPSLPLAFFEELLARVKRLRPKALLKCFTAVEIAHFARLESITPREVLARLKNVGLVMMPGGGAEIFDPEVRTRICPHKLTAEEWLDIHRLAHSMGLRTNCTMLFGHLETRRHRMEHLDALRRLQDETGGFTCFIPLPFQTENSRLTGITPLTGLEELRTIAVSRLMLDNIRHIKAYWVMLGVKQAQAALYYGADDLDGTVVEEKIGHMAGAKSEAALTKTELMAMIRHCGFTPVERDSLFNELSEPSAPLGPASQEAACAS
ncbi:aminofutalosine synthase MqnE [Desulfocurvibacter africanus]|uniref:Aminodeoxyfutalosine synthase n=2 Tax=Desulfocurvibacter africanus TaxID=873 RepID=F3Z1V0_DESAF|nr:aminofutalosine synthase MqnE [Desulfocurvibacter africanus]EGJ50058.1 putative menaquinone biosynthesis protein [Desulfocurvibacter africanus subsp. africanus str. Walvis Bay]